MILVSCCWHNDPTLWMLSSVTAQRPKFSCNYQPESVCHSLIITDIEWHLPPGQRETCFFGSVNRWPQDGGGCCYYSKYLTENVECQRPFYPPGELEERSQMLWCGFRAFVLHITLTSCQTLWKMLSTFDICWMIFFFFSAQGLSDWKLNVQDVTCNSAHTLFKHTSDVCKWSDTDIKSQLIYSFPLSLGPLPEFHHVLSRKSGSVYQRHFALRERHVFALPRRRWADVRMIFRFFYNAGS